MADVSQGLTFKSVIMGNFFRLSESSAQSMPFNSILDSTWAFIEPFLDEYDKEEWRKKCAKPIFSEEMLYETNMNKIKIISLVLYKTGVFPNRDNLQHRKNEAYTSGGSKKVKGMSVHIIDDIKIHNFFMRHLFLMSYITKNGGKFDVHIDVLWAVLSPYITEEDYDTWELNNEALKRGQFDEYQWNIEKIRICMRVLERADFLFESGITDEPEDYGGSIDNKGEFGTDDFEVVG